MTLGSCCLERQEETQQSAAAGPGPLEGKGVNQNQAVKLWFFIGESGALQYHLCPQEPPKST